MSREIHSGTWLISEPYTGEIIPETVVSADGIWYNQFIIYTIARDHSVLASCDQLSTADFNQTVAYSSIVLVFRVNKYRAQVVASLQDRSSDLAHTSGKMNALQPYAIGKSIVLNLCYALT